MTNKRVITIFWSNWYIWWLEDIFKEVTRKWTTENSAECYFEWVLDGIKTEYNFILTYIPTTKKYQWIIKTKTILFVLSNSNKQDLYKEVVWKLKELGFKEKFDIFNMAEDSEFTEEKVDSFKKVDFTEKDLYSKFKKSIENSETFYSSSQTIDWNIIESFSYRLASWSEFNSDSLKKEMRGLAFITDKEKNTNLFTIWFHKFFNYWEWEWENSTVNILHREQIESIDDKLDWSLILVWRLPDNRIIAKSKTSINSDQAVKSTEIINKSKELQFFINTLLDNWLFPIFEYVWPDNRIVLSYNTSELVLTGIRKTKDGTYLHRNEREKLRKELAPNLKSSVSHEIWFNDVLQKQENDKWYEWFVVSFKNGDRMKVKLKSYVQLHHTKDEVNNVKRVIEMALDENLDDLRTLFVEDQNVLEYITRVEDEVFKLYNHIVTTVEAAYTATKDLPRKEFAIYHKENDYFGLIMQKYVSMTEWKEWIPDYKTFVKKTIRLDDMMVTPENTEN